MASGIYDKLGEERKKLQADGNMPEWWSTGGWQLFKEKYLYQAAHPREQYQRIAATLAAHTPDPAVWKDKFFDIMWKGWLSPSTPVLANTGTNRGLPVSCAGSYFPDSINGIYKAKHETAILTKYGFGTAGYLGDIRSRGTNISVGGKASGLLPIIEGVQKDMEYVVQGTARRGSWAGYVPISHGDFHEICSYLEQHPDGNNIGWNVYDEDLAKLAEGDQETAHRFQKALKTKMVTGKGYFFFPDKANRRRPQWYVDHNLDVKAAQLCLTYDTEIWIATDEEGSNAMVAPLGLIASCIQLRVLCADIFVLSFNTDEKVNEWKRITDGAKTGTVTELYEIEDEEGNVIECTPDHKVWTENRGYVTAKDLVESDVVRLR